MGVLLDENLPHDLIADLVGHFVSTVRGLRWAGTKNGVLLKRASSSYDELVIDSSHELRSASVLPPAVECSPSAADVMCVASAYRRPAMACRAACRSCHASTATRIKVARSAPHLEQMRVPRNGA